MTYDGDAAPKLEHLMPQHRHSRRSPPTVTGGLRHHRVVATNRAGEAEKAHSGSKQGSGRATSPRRQRVIVLYLYVMLLHDEQNLNDFVGRKKKGFFKRRREKKRQDVSYNKSD